MGWDTQQITEWDTEVTDESTEVDKVLFNNLTSVEERLTIDVDIKTVKGRYSDREEFIQTLETAITLNASPDLVCQYGLTSSIGTLKGLYDNLLTTTHLDFDAPWWNETLVEGNIINGNLYYITGEITPTVVYNMYSVMFNKDLLSAHQIEAPYSLVKSGNWTLNQMMSLIKDTSLNPNGSGIYSGATENVLYGLNVQKLSVDALQTGFGVVAVQRNEDDSWGLSADYTGTKSVDAVDAIRNLVYNNGDVFYDKGHGTNNAIFYGDAIFGDGKALFDIGTLGQVERMIRDRKLSVGVVPTPKYDGTQENYYTRLAPMVSLFSIPVGSPDRNRASAVLEALGSSGYHYVTPVIFETTFRSRYSESPDDAEMFLKIRDGIVYDPGDFHDALGTFSAFRNCVASNQSWTGYFDAKSPTYVAELEKINAVGKPAAEE
jgi:ABC-type glycerol-3-phosphate transport system substrate-binding protein